jgi:MarR family transcriptional regulator, organic hydroperoxide resistance regulator
MSADGRENLSTERVDQLLQHLTEIVPRMGSMPPEMRTHLMSQLDGLHSKFSPHLIAEPPTMYRLTSMLYRDPKPTMGELSKSLSLPLSTVSRIVSMLEEQGFAKRLPDAEDGRVVRVDLTDSGRQIYEAMLSHGLRNAQRVLDCLTPEEQMILLTLLGKVAANLKKDT